VDRTYVLLEILAAKGSDAKDLFKLAILPKGASRFREYDEVEDEQDVYEVMRQQQRKIWTSTVCGLRFAGESSSPTRSGQSQ